MVTFAALFIQVADNISQTTATGELGKTQRHKL